MPLGLLLSHAAAFFSEVKYKIGYGKGDTANMAPGKCATSCGTFSAVPQAQIIAGHVLEIPAREAFHLGRKPEDRLQAA
jgi:hypothetical protein